MIYRFKIVSEDTDAFRREIEIDPDADFMALRNAILDSVGYSRDEINSFFICDDDWRRRQEVSIMDFGSRSDQDLYLMDQTPLSDLRDDEGQKLEFVYDGLSDRSFFIELKEIITGKSLPKPICTLSHGKAPAQHIDLDTIDLLTEKKTASRPTDLDMDDFYGDSEFNEGDLDGFEDVQF